MVKFNNLMTPVQYKSSQVYDTLESWNTKAAD